MVLGMSPPPMNSIIVVIILTLFVRFFFEHRPYTCECSADGTGADFVNMQVTTNVPGTKSRSKAKATDFALVAQMPA